MNVDALTIVALIGFLGLTIVGLVGYVRKLHGEQLTDCRAGRDECERRSRKQQEQIDALIDGDIDRARSKRDTDVMPVLHDPTPSKRRLIGLLVVLGLGLATSLTMAACRGDGLPVRELPPEAPAAAMARDLRGDEIFASKAAALARATGNLPEAAKQDAIADITGKLADAAEKRAATEQAAIDRRFDDLKAKEVERAAIAAKDATDLHLRMIAGFGMALSAAAAVGMFLAGIPARFSIAIPGAIAAGCTVLVVWPTLASGMNIGVRYFMIASGCLLGLSMVIALGWLVRWVFGEWHHYSNHLADVMPEAKAAADNASRARQPWLIRWVIDLMHKGHGKIEDVKKDITQAGLAA